MWTYEHPHQWNQVRTLYELCLICFTEHNFLLSVIHFHTIFCFYSFPVDSANKTFLWRHSECSKYSKHLNNQYGRFANDGTIRNVASNRYSRCGVRIFQSLIISYLFKHLYFIGWRWKHLTWVWKANLQLHQPWKAWVTHCFWIRFRSLGRRKLTHLWQAWLHGTCKAMSKKYKK